MALYKFRDYDYDCILVSTGPTLMLSGPKVEEASIHGEIKNSDLASETD